MMRGTLYGVFIGSAIAIVFLAFAFGVNGAVLVFVVGMVVSGVALFVIQARDEARR